MADGCKVTASKHPPPQASATRQSGSKSGSRSNLIAGFVSYQIPKGVQPPPPSDNIQSYDHKRYSSSVHSLNRHHQNNGSRHGGGNSSRRRENGEDRYEVQQSRGRDVQRMHHHAGIHPANLHNGGRAFSVQLGGSNHLVRLRGSPGYIEAGKGITVYEGAECAVHTMNYEPPPWQNEPAGKRYPRSPGPRRPVHLADGNGTIDVYRKPPLPPVDTPKPPPRSRPRSWTSTLFNAFRGGGAKAGTLPNPASLPPPPAQQPAAHANLPHNTVLPPPPDYMLDMDTTWPDMPSNTNTLDKRQYGPKQVRFLANPSKIETNPKFYSLPRFIGQPTTVAATDKLKVVGKTPKGRSRTPSPFGRFVKSLVKGNGHFTADFLCVKGYHNIFVLFCPIGVIHILH